MSEEREGIIVILSSPSGAGKTTLVKKIASSYNLSVSISHTTRKPRTNETHGEHYYFVSNKEFQNLIDNKKFLEHAKVFNHFYGSSEDHVLNKLENGKSVIFDIDWQGAKQIKEKKLNYKIKSVFILPPSKKELFKRLLSRDLNNLEIANERMKQFENDVKHWKDYEYVVINDDLEKCFKEIIHYIFSDKKKIKFDQEFIQKHVEKLLL